MADHTETVSRSRNHDNYDPPKEGSHHALSCTHCRQRKVKCDKVYPCAHCQRSNLTCVFPERAKNAKKKKNGPKTSNEELLRRLKRMEELIGKMEGDDKPEESSPSAPKTESTPSSENLNGSISRTTISSRSPSLPNDRDGHAEDGLNRYIGNSFLRSLTAEVEGLKQSMDDATDDEDISSPSAKSPSDTQTPNPSTVFGSILSAPRELRFLHPSPMHITLLCNIFIDNVDPVFKVVHTPTLRKMVADLVVNVDAIPTGNYVEALLFAIYYAAIASLTQQECLANFQDGKEALLAKYRAGTERALSNANFLIDCDLGTLQALTIFLACVRANDNSQYVWTMISIAIRLGHSLGLHREGSRSCLTPFVQEIRRRLWWSIVSLDFRCAEDKGSEPIVLRSSFNTRLPLNINDSDMDPESTQPIIERDVFTEMTAPSLSFEVWDLCSRIAYNPPPKEGEETNMPTVDEKLKVLMDLEYVLEHKFRSRCDTSIPLHWSSSVVAQLIVRRVRLAIYHPLQFGSQPVDRPKVSKDILLKTAVEILELAHLLDTDPIATRWKWYYATFVQWHALAATLAELCVQTRGELVERAWRLIDVVFENWAERIADSPNGMLWRPIKKLKNKAQATRAAAQVSVRPSLKQEQLPLPYFGTAAVTNLQTPTVEAPSFASNGLPLMGSADMMVDAPPAAASVPLNNNGGGGGLNGLPPDGLAGLNVGDSSSGAVNWAEWDDFMQDYQLDLQQTYADPGPPDKWW